MRAWFLRATLVLATVGCSPAPVVKPPPPPVSQAPRELAALAIHVHQLASPPESAYDEFDYKHMSGLTGGLREAFQVALVRAGYTVIVDRRGERDVEAKIQATWPNDAPGVATLTLEADGKVIEQVSAVLPLLVGSPYGEHLEEHGAVALVEAMARSGKVAELSRWKAAQQKKKTPQVAAPGEVGR